MNIEKHFQEPKILKHAKKKFRNPKLEYPPKFYKITHSTTRPTPIKTANLTNDHNSTEEEKHWQIIIINFTDPTAEDTPIRWTRADIVRHDPSLSDWDTFYRSGCRISHSRFGPACSRWRLNEPADLTGQFFPRNPRIQIKNPRRCRCRPSSWSDWKSHPYTLGVSVGFSLFCCAKVSDGIRIWKCWKWISVFS